MSESTRPAGQAQDALDTGDTLHAAPGSGDSRAEGRWESRPRPLLSILIPAFNYPHGVFRILRQLADAAAGTDEIEVLIADDSRDDSLREPALRLASELGLNLHYEFNQPTRGAVGNWNHLLDRARGRYQWLVHHDEFPLTRQTVPRLLEVLRADDAPDAVLLDCVLFDPETSQAWSHVPNWLRRVVAYSRPGFLWYRNTFGPTAAMVVRRERYPRFDPALRWLVDVDLYTRVLTPDLKLAFLPELSIGSVLNREDSITAQLGGTVGELQRRERAYLLERPDLRHGNWLRHVEAQSLASSVLHASSRVAWYLLSKLTRLASNVGLGAHSRDALRAGFAEAMAGEPARPPVPEIDPWDRVVPPSDPTVAQRVRLSPPEPDVSVHRDEAVSVVPVGRARDAASPDHGSARKRFTLIENVIANYAYLIVMGLSTLIATPIYVRSLGAAEWGMVALCMTLQGVLLLLDLGLTQVMPREVARHGHGLAHHVYRGFLKLYGLPAVAVGIGGQFFAPQIAEYLIGPGPQLHDFTVAVRLALVQFMFQFSNNAAIGLWNGLEMQRLASVRLASFGLVKHSLALLLVTQWSPQVLSYMVPFAVVCGAEFTANWLRIRRSMPRQQIVGGGSAINMRATLVSVAGFSGAVLIGMLTGQVDRIFLARNVPTEAYGAYVVCANLALSMMQLYVPLHRAFLPRLMAPGRSTRSLGVLFASVCALCVAPCLVGAWAATPILELWIGRAEVVQSGAPVLRWILVAMAMNGVYSVAHLLMIKQDYFGRLAALNALILLTQVVFLLVWGQQLELLAGAGSWLICGGLQMLAGMVFMTHYLFAQRPAQLRHA